MRAHASSSPHSPSPHRNRNRRNKRRLRLAYRPSRSRSQHRSSIDTSRAYLARSWGTGRAVRVLPCLMYCRPLVVVRVGLWIQQVDVLCRLKAVIIMGTDTGTGTTAVDVEVAAVAAAAEWWSAHRR